MLTLLLKTEIHKSDRTNQAEEDYDTLKIW